MKFKTAQWTSEAFESVFKTFDKFPVHMVTDRGLEFYTSSKSFSKLRYKPLFNFNKIKMESINCRKSNPNSEN